MTLGCKTASRADYTHRDDCPVIVMREAQMGKDVT